MLHRTLEDKGFNAWVDWQDIPPSTDWLKEIFEAIEQAEIFIFVISRFSIESDICSREIEHAVANNKRIIPVVLDDIDSRKIAPHLASINWIFCREGDKLSQVFEDLLSAIHVNYEWVKAHTRLQVRALDWDKKDRKPGYLLDGRDLAESEQWLNWSLAHGENPPPTKLQKEYIASSRKSLVRRKHIITTLAVLSAMLIAVSAFSYFYVQATILKQKQETNLFSELVRSAQSGDLETLKIAIGTKVDLNILDDSGRAPLHLAVAEKQAGAVALLLDANAMVNLADIEGNTPLHHATGNNNSEVLLLLLEAGADTNILNNYGDAPLHKAARIDNASAISSLLTAGTNVNIRNHLLGQTALHMVAVGGYSDEAQLLLDAGADIDLTCHHFGWTPLHYAARFGNGEMVQLLLRSGANKYILDKQGNSPYDLAESENQADILDLLK